MLTCEGALLGRSHTSVRPVAVETRFRLPGGSGRSEEGRRTIMNRKISWKYLYHLSARKNVISFGLFSYGKRTLKHALPTY